MKKSILSAAMAICMATMMICTFPFTSSAAVYPSLDNVTKYDMANFGIGSTDLTKEWVPIGNCTHTMNEDNTLATITPSATSGYYYGPASEYGIAKVKNVAIAMTFGIKFKDGANDFGAMLILKGQKTEPSWSIQNGIVLRFYPDKIALGNIQYGTVEDLSVYNNILDPDKNYNLEFIAIDTEDNKTDAYVKITDENGKVLADADNKTGFTMIAKGIEDSAEEGYVTLFGNDAQAENFRFGTGRFIPFEGDPEQDVSSESDSSKDDASNEDTSKEDTSKNDTSKDDTAKDDASKNNGTPETGVAIPLGAMAIGLTAGALIGTVSKKNKKK